MTRWYAYTPAVEKSVLHEVTTQHPVDLRLLALYPWHCLMFESEIPIVILRLLADLAVLRFVTAGSSSHPFLH